MENRRQATALWIFLILVAACRQVASIPACEINVNVTSRGGVVLQAIPFSLSLNFGLDPTKLHQCPDLSYRIHNRHNAVLAQGKVIMTFPLPKIVADVQLHEVGWSALSVSVGDEEMSYHQETLSLFCVPGILSIAPPVTTLLVSIVSKNVFVSMLVGIWVGATILENFNPIKGFVHTFDKYWVHAFTDDGHAPVLLFAVVLGGVIGLVQKNGGALGLAMSTKRAITTRSRMQIGTWLLSWLIFFDDYSSILIVGTSFRSLLKEKGISREKFAFFVHSMAACLASMAPVSTWIGVEVGYLQAQLRAINVNMDPFTTCLQSLPYRYFPILLPIFLLILSFVNRDFSVMSRCERNAIKARFSIVRANIHDNVADSTSDSTRTIVDSPLEPSPQTPLRWYNALAPFVLIVFATFSGIIVNGYHSLYAMPVDIRPAPTLINAMSLSNSIMVLIQSAAYGCLLAFGLTLYENLLTLDDAVKAWIDGAKMVFEPNIVLLLAWALGSVVIDIQTASYLNSIIPESLPANLVPAISALLGYSVSFCTGSSFGAMAIIFPVVIPLASRLSHENEEIIIQSVGAILGSVVFGNISSPISDTSVLMSLTSGIPMEAHVKTVFPYASLIAVTSFFTGQIGVSFGLLSLTQAYVYSVLILFVAIFVAGSPISVASFPLHHKLARPSIAKSQASDSAENQLLLTHTVPRYDF